MTRVLLVGGGLTSALTGAILRREIPHVELVLWDKSRGAGIYDQLFSALGLRLVMKGYVYNFFFTSVS